MDCLHGKKSYWEQQEGKLQSISPFQISACIMFADVPLAKSSLNNSLELVWESSTKEYG